MDAEGGRKEDTCELACPVACRREMRDRRVAGSSHRSRANMASSRPAARGVRASSFDCLGDPDAVDPGTLGNSRYDLYLGLKEQHPG